MKQRIKDFVDQIVVEREFARKFVIFEQMLGSVITYALQSYATCRDIIQFTLGQMERIPTECVSYFFMGLFDERVGGGARDLLYGAGCAEVF